LPRTRGTTPIEEETGTIAIKWFDDAHDRSSPDFLENLTNAVGTMSYLVRLHTYWKLDLAGRLGALKPMKTGGNYSDKIHRYFTIEIPSSSLMTVDSRKFGPGSAPYRAGADKYDVDLPNLTFLNTLDDLRSAFGHLAYLEFLTSMWHTDLWKRLGFDRDSWHDDPDPK
jgi:hypothetical protein